MNAELADEIESVNAIYGSNVLSLDNESSLFLLVPNASIKLRLRVPAHYPGEIPLMEGPETSGASLRKGEASAFAEEARQTLHRVFREGEPCMFELIEELKESNTNQKDELAHGNESPEDGGLAESVDVTDVLDEPSSVVVPKWSISDVVTEKKSVFVARAARVKDPTTAKKNMQHLLATDKKAAKATHNITAWRMKDEESGVTFRDCDDDGETAAGSRLLHLLELMDVWNTMVVVTRWFGGVHLGPDRFRIINSVARDAILRLGSAEASEERAGNAARKKRP